MKIHLGMRSGWIVYWSELINWKLRKHLCDGTWCGTSRPVSTVQTNCNPRIPRRLGLISPLTACWHPRIIMASIIERFRVFQRFERFFHQSMWEKCSEAGRGKGYFRFEQFLNFSPGPCNENHNVTSRENKSIYNDKKCIYIDWI